MRNENARPRGRWYFGGSTLIALLLGTVGFQSGSGATGNATAPDDADARGGQAGTSANDSRWSGLAETLLSRKEPTRQQTRLRNPTAASCRESPEHAAICETWSQVDAAWNARDAERFSRLFAEDVTFRFVQRRQSLDGRTTILEHFTERFPRFAPDLRHRTRISTVDAVAPGVFTADGKVEIQRHAGDGGAAPTVLRTFAIFAVMSGKDENWSIRSLRIYELSPAAEDAR